MDVEVIFDLVVGDKAKTEALQRGGIFRPDEFHGEFKTLALKTDLILRREGAKMMMDIIRDTMEKEGKQIIFINVRRVRDVYNVHDVTPYIMPNVRTITSGKRSGPFASMLNQLGYGVSIDHNFVVKSAVLQQTGGARR